MNVKSKAWCVAAGTLLAGSVSAGNFLNPTEWTGGSGTWSSGPWSNGAPTANGTAVINGVTVTTDAGATAGWLKLGGGAKLLLGADFSLATTEWDYTPLSTDASVTVDLNGHTFSSQNNKRNKYDMNGVWKMGEGSFLHLRNYDGSQNAMQMHVLGTLQQVDSRILFDFGLNNFGTTSHEWGRKFVNDGVWTMDHSLFELNIDWPAGQSRDPKGPTFGYLENCENNGTLSLANGSTNVVGNLINRGTLTLSDSSVGYVRQGKITVDNRPGASVSVLGTSAILAYDDNGDGNFLVNGGLLTVGDAEGAETALEIPGTHCCISNYADAVMTVYSNAVVNLRYASQGSRVQFINQGTLNMPGGEIFFDWRASGNGTANPRRWLNEGTWTMSDGASFRFGSTVGRDVWGFASVDDASNRGTMNLSGGSTLGVNWFNNDGLLRLGDGVTVNNAPYIYAERRFSNRGRIEVTGAAAFGYTACVDGGNSYVFTQSQRDAAEAPLLLVGTNETDAASLTLGGSSKTTLALEAGRIEVAAKSSLAIMAMRENTNNGSDAILQIAPGATFVNRGDLVLRADNTAWAKIEVGTAENPGGRFALDGTAGDGVRILRGFTDETRGTWGVQVVNYGEFVGRGGFTFVDRTTRHIGDRSLYVHNYRDFVVGPGGFTVNTAQKFTAEFHENSRFVFDLGKDPANFGSLVMKGTCEEVDNNNMLMLKDDVTLVLRFPKKRNAWAGTRTLRLIDYVAMGGLDKNQGCWDLGIGSNRGNGKRFASVRLEDEDGNEITDGSVKAGAVQYGWGFVDIQVKACSRGLAIVIL